MNQNDHRYSHRTIAVLAAAVILFGIILFAMENTNRTAAPTVSQAVKTSDKQAILNYMETATPPKVSSAEEQSVLAAARQKPPAVSPEEKASILNAIKAP